MDIYSLTKNEAKIFELLSSAEFVSDEQILEHVQGFVPSLVAEAKKETRSHTMAVRRLNQKLDNTQRIERVRGRGFRLVSGD